MSMEHIACILALVRTGQGLSCGPTTAAGSLLYLPKVLYACESARKAHTIIPTACLDLGFVDLRSQVLVRSVLAIAIASIALLTFVQITI
jgi:hypothetical protein